MNKKHFGMSVLGYAIVFVIVLAIIMIISAPMMVEKYNVSKNSNQAGNSYSQNSVDSYGAGERRSRRSNRSDESLQNLSEEMQNMESRLSSRIDELEQVQADYEQGGSSDVSDKYVCTIDGALDENDEIVPLSSNFDLKSQKIVFICEYRK